MVNPLQHVDDRHETRLWESLRTAAGSVEEANSQCAQLARTTLRAAAQDLLSAVEGCADPSVRAHASTLGSELEALDACTSETAAAVLSLADAAFQTWGNAPSLPYASDVDPMPAF